MCFARFKLLKVRYSPHNVHVLTYGKAAMLQGREVEKAHAEHENVSAEDPISTLGTRTIPDTLVRIPIQPPSTSS